VGDPAASIEHDRLTRGAFSHRPLPSRSSACCRARSTRTCAVKAARGLVDLSRQAEAEGRRGFGGYGIGGALEKENLGIDHPAGCARSCRRTGPATCWASPSPTTCSTCDQAAGADTFDCVAPDPTWRRNAAVYTPRRPATTSWRPEASSRDFGPLDTETARATRATRTTPAPTSTTCYKAKEMLFAGTLCTHPQRTTSSMTLTSHEIRTVHRVDGRFDELPRPRSSAATTRTRPRSCAGGRPSGRPPRTRQERAFSGASSSFPISPES
jgi:queuine tRNA-ribosyltransferase